ncbi:hypothetical protein ACA910_021553 [Epithemia clementina (nom. ined.)]
MVVSGKQHRAAPDLPEPSAKKVKFMSNSGSENQNGSNQDQQGAASPDGASTLMDDSNSDTSSNIYSENGLDNLPSAEEIESFFLKEPVTKEERALVDGELESNVARTLHKLEKKGAGKAFSEYVQSKKALENAARQRKMAAETKFDELAVFTGVPRSYQIKLMNWAAKMNTIVHLGTGMGKTLIAILLIRRMTDLDEEEVDEGRKCGDSADSNDRRDPGEKSNSAKGETADGEDDQTSNKIVKRARKQVVFLVPSVALVLQQTSTLKANLPLTIGTAFRATVNSESSRQQLARCDLLVATHGAYLDLLLHFGDLFALEQVQLLIMDECHNCVKNSPYATLMRDFYHPLRTEKRPRVMGLTASPLINIKKNCGEEDLAMKLNELETTLDARVIPLTDLGLEQDDIPAFLRKDAQEEIVTYQSSRLSRRITLDEPNWSEYLARAGLNRSREKEFRQVQCLYDELGPHVTQLFCRRLRGDITRNMYEQETEDQFHRAHEFLRTVLTYCQKLCRLHPGEKFTPKLRALHSLLNQQLDQRPDAVGLVFVQRRVTALALHEHFRFILRERRRRQNNPDTSDCCDPDDEDWNMPNSTQISYTEHAHQFEDADDDDEVMLPAQQPVVHAESKPVTSEQHEESTDAQATGQFDDAAEDDPFEIRKPVSNQVKRILSSSQSFVDDSILVEVKSGALVRKPSSMFRVMRKSDAKGRANSKGCALKSVEIAEDEEEALSLREQETSIREVLNNMRKREINLLIATSVVEEGVDIQACSFVVVFDALTSLKAFIQMKGRARQKDASFFVFEETNVESDIMPLSTVKDVEARVNKFLASRGSSSVERVSQLAERPIPTRSLSLSDDEQITTEELQAMDEGQFRTENGTVTLRGAKSLLHRYALMQPMDPAVRTSRASMRAHLPSFDFQKNQLSIPSHLGTYDDIRMVPLPQCFAGRSKKERESLVSLRACVRLYQHGLLNDRLLPLSEKDIQARFVTASRKSACREATVDVLKPLWYDLDRNCMPKLYLHPVVQVGETLHGYLKQLNPGGRKLGILSWTPIVDIPKYEYSTGQLGDIEMTLGEGFPICCSHIEIETASRFFDLIWNARWKRRTRDNHFQCSAGSTSYFVYRIVCLDRENKLDWEHMNELIKESERPSDERMEIVRIIDTKNPLPCPRLWSPRYDENACYLVYGPSGDVCNSEFPHDHQDERIKTYKDYYEYQHQCKVPADSILFDAARQWQLPRRAWSDSHETVDEFKKVKLPHYACMEPVLANAGMSLLTVLLPQFCHHVELHVSLQKFLEHVEANVPDLARFLFQISKEKLINAITAKSCNATGCYEKLEWLGDGVLKLVQTDALINSTDLGSWIRHLPEGYLNSARSFMGSNWNLTVACKKLKLEMFIQTESLSRGLWTPSPMELVNQENKPVQHSSSIDGKVCADVLESLIGLVYLEFGFKEAMVASDALQLTIPHKDNELLASTKDHTRNLSTDKIVDVAETFTGYQPFGRKSLVEEALTHPTKLSASTSYSSYQRLEWIGDAVLCLAIRSWIYNNLPDLELGSMVLLEATLVCNETLAFLAVRAGLPLHLRHGDQTLPGRIESYEWSVKEKGRGLWGTDPPKALADIVEALFGAVYIDGGFHAGQNTVYHAFRSIILSLKKASDIDIERYCCHPKRNVLSELGCLVSVEQIKEETLSESLPHLRIWCGDHWENPHPNRNRPVSVLKCVGDPILAVTDTIVSSAVNRVCAFLLAFLFDHKPYLVRFRTLKGDVQRSLSGKESTEKSDYPNYDSWGATDPIPEWEVGEQINHS